MQNRKCVLLINLGSPEKPSTSSIRRYLRTFLSDPRVLDMPGFIRWMILNLFILPFRPSAILPKYEKIWDGSRFLLVKYSDQLVDALGEKLGNDYQVKMAMRYSEPSISNILSQINSAGVSELIIVPLFPQYASATGGSILEAVISEIKHWAVIPQMRIVTRFYDEQGFINAHRQVAKPFLADAPDHILFSFHGLPESHILKIDTSNHCLKTDDCCGNYNGINVNCYRAQCFQTARLIAESLDLDKESYSIGFQSRLGRAKWIGPSTRETIDRLAADGVQNLLVLCPSFVADCLETVEEIGVEEKAYFQQRGGQVLTLVPSLNADPVWVEALSNLIKREI